jgi:hypothetical protein
MKHYLTIKRYYKEYLKFFKDDYLYGHIQNWVEWVIAIQCVIVGSILFLIIYKLM